VRKRSQKKSVRGMAEDAGQTTCTESIEGNRD